MALLDDVLRGVALPTGATSTHPAQRGAVLLTDSDPKLSLDSLGLRSGEVAVLRLPGAGMGMPAVAAHAVGSAAWLHGCSEVIVLATERPSTLEREPGEAAMRVRARGGDPLLLPGGVRSTLGQHGSTREALGLLVRSLRASAFLPPGTLVHAALVGASGAAEVVDRDAVREQKGLDEATLAYREGPTGALSTAGLGDGLAALAPSGFGQLASGASLFASAADPFQAAANLLPAGWADGSEALRPAAPGADLVAAAQAAESSLPEGMSWPDPSLLDRPIDFRGTERSAAEKSAPRKARQESGRPRQKEREKDRDKERSRPRSPPPETKPAPKPTPRVLEAQEMPQRDTRALKASTSSPHHQQIRAFIRENVEVDARRRIGRALAEAFNAGRSSDELSRLFVKPLLDLAEKRYAILDPLITLKEQVIALPPDQAYEVLTSLLTQ